MTTPRVLVAMSGGVDSSVAALLLQRQGYDVAGMTAELFGNTSAAGPCCGREGAEAARQVCNHLGISHHIVDLCNEFESLVIERFISEYRAGRTPNPCTDCNRFIKFERFFDVAEKLGCTHIATGHYARIMLRDDKPGEYLLRAGVDTAKDQSYFLACIAAEKLAQLLYPVGEYTKAEVRQLAAEAELPTATRNESQDICFLPPGTGIAELLSWHTGNPPHPGQIIDTEGNVIGQHPGVEHFTIGQRKGLRLGGGSEGLVVHKLIPATNTVVIAQADAHPITHIELTEFTDLASGLWQSGDTLAVRSRYRQELWPAVITVDGNHATVVPTGAQYAMSAGQWLVGYNGDTVAFGGIIDRIAYRD